MMSQNSSDTPAVIYRTPADWDAFVNQLKLRAEATDLWEATIGLEAWPVAPQAPVLGEFERAQDPNLSAAQRRAQGLPERVSQLSEAGRLDYQQACRDYEFISKKWEAYRTRKATLQTWVLSSVSPTYRLTCCHDGNLNDWYTRLLATAQPEMRNKETKASDGYDATMALLTHKTTHKQLAGWIEEWEKAMALGVRYEISQVHKTLTWTNHLFTALGRTEHLTSWVTSFRLTKQTKIDDKSLSYIEVAADMRAELQLAAKTVPPRNRISRGVHAAHAVQYGEEEPAAGVPAEHEERGSSSRRGRGRGRGRGSAGGVRKRQDDEDGTTQRRRQPCGFCSYWHDTDTCWAAFPETAPPWASELQSIKRARERIQNDKDLKRQVDEARAKRAGNSA